MIQAIKHRGPDGEGFYFHHDQGVGLGHARLAILDLSDAGRQPMNFQSSRCWMVYNGEVYNFIEIRHELIAKGYQFYSDSDTEVILAAWIEWGEDAFLRFNGMWALALYDERTRKLILCRDRYGIKPLYYYYQNHQLVFGSEYKAFLPVMDILKIDWDYRGIKTAVIDPFLLESSGHSLFKGVRSLQPGHLLCIQESKCVVKRWWNTLDHLHPVPAGLPSQAEQFRHLFQDACSLRMRSDVPIGTALSGGIDSSSVAVMMNDVASRTGNKERWPSDYRKTFVHSFPGTPLDETAYAQSASQAAGVQPVYVFATEPELLEHLDEVLYAFESIYLGMPDAAWRIYQAQRSHGIVVSLDGHGADEMLGGYDWHVTALLQDTPLYASAFRQLLRQKAEMTAGLVGPLDGSPAMPNLQAALTAASIFAKKFTGRATTFFAPPRFFSNDAERVHLYPFQDTRLSGSCSHFQHRIFNDFHHRILPRILKNFDLMSMAHGVEVRMPFMDYRLVNYSFSLPPESKINAGWTKLVLREAMKGLLPEDIRLRKLKIGFNSPLLNWLPGMLRPWVEDCLSNPDLEFPLIDRKKLSRCYSRRALTGRWNWQEAMVFWKHVNALKLIRILTAKRLAMRPTFSQSHSESL
jgi:asparagine synthase (glutamine-hydrolysing)